MSKYIHLVLVIILSFLPFLFFLFHPLLFHTHDGLVHLPRIAAYVKALQDLHIPVRWAGDLNYGYGLPLFNFMYPLPYMVASLFVLLGIHLVMAFKLSLFLSYLLSGIGMYLFGRAFFQDSRKAFAVTIFYQFASFRFVELFVRGSLGEVYTYTFLPFVLWSITSFSKKPSVKTFSIIALSVCFLILSHNAISLVFFSICCLFIGFFVRKRKEGFYIGTACLLGIMLAAFYWLPAIGEHKYTYGNLFMKDLYRSHFAPFFTFFIPNITNNPVLQTGGIAVQIGLLHTISLIASFTLLFFSKKKKNTDEKRVVAFGLLLFVGALFFMQPVSTFLWEHISLLRQFQFPWRFLSVVVFASSLVSAPFMTLSFFKKNIVFYAVLALVVLSSIPYWTASLGYDKVQEAYYWNFPLNTTYYGETDIIWSAGPAKKYPTKRVDVIGGKAEITDFVKKTQQHSYTVKAKGTAQLVDHTQYFPGWKVMIDGKQIPIQFQDPNWRGEITFYVPSGTHRVIMQFEESMLRIIADTISIIALLSLVLIAFFKKSFR